MFNYVGETKFLTFFNEIERQFNIITTLDDPDNDIDDSNGKLQSNIRFNGFGRIGLGAYFPDISKYNFNRIITYEDMIGHKLQYLLIFKAWGDVDREFPYDIVTSSKALGVIPVITWEPWKRDFNNPTDVQPEYSLYAIIEGHKDAYIRQWAQQAKQSDYDMIIRFGHEQSTPLNNVAWYPWQGRPVEYVKAYRHIISIFRQEGADKVKFMWNPITFTSDITTQYYPGDDYIDYIGLTVINHGTRISKIQDGKWKTCDFLYTSQLDQLKSISKPMIVVEFASSEYGGDKALWISDCVRRIMATPSVVGLVTLETPNDSSLPEVDWRINTTQSSLNAYKRITSSSIFK